MRAAANGTFDDFLVAFIAEPHRENGIALRQDCRVKLARALADDAKIGTVFSAFLGNPGYSLPCRPEAGVAVGRNIAVSFFADHQRLQAAFA